MSIIRADLFPQPFPPCISTCRCCAEVTRGSYPHTAHFPNPGVKLTLVRGWGASFSPRVTNINLSPTPMLKQQHHARTGYVFIPYGWGHPQLEGRGDMPVLFSLSHMIPYYPTSLIPHRLDRDNGLWRSRTGPTQPITMDPGGTDCRFRKKLDTRSLAPPPPPPIQSYNTES